MGLKINWMAYAQLAEWAYSMPIRTPPKNAREQPVKISY
jgi:hypothetical protein